MLKLLLAIFFNFSQVFAVEKLTIAKYRFTGYKNVWHEEVHLHEKLDVGNMATDTEATIVELCANKCVLAKDGCEAFYIQTDPTTGTECNLVNEDLGLKNRTYGHGEDMEDVYYVKELVSSERVDRPQELEPPCDQDNSTANCSGIFDGLRLVTYYTCEAENTFNATIGLVSDMKCPGEDRIKQCELAGGIADSNIVEASKEEVIRNAFWKYAEQRDPLRTPTLQDGKPVWMEMTFRNGSQEVRRIIIRSAFDRHIDKLKSGKVTLYKGDKTAEIPFEFKNINDCVMMIYIEAGNQDVKDVAAKADKIRLDSITTFEKAKGKVGFKIDLFIKEKIIVFPTAKEPPITTTTMANPGNNSTNTTEA